jgi:hypothetical protein
LVILLLNELNHFGGILAVNILSLAFQLLLLILDLLSSGFARHTFNNLYHRR